MSGEQRREQFVRHDGHCRRLRIVVPACHDDDEIERGDQVDFLPAVARGHHHVHAAVAAGERDIGPLVPPEIPVVLVSDGRPPRRRSPDPLARHDLAALPDALLLKQHAKLEHVARTQVELGKGRGVGCAERVVPSHLGGADPERREQLLLGKRG